MERQLRNMGGRIGFQEGGIMPRLNQLGSGVSSAEQMLQGINQRLQSAESTLGSGGGAMQQPIGGLVPGIAGYESRKEAGMGQPKQLASLATSVQTPDPFFGKGSLNKLDSPLPLRGGAELMQLAGIPMQSQGTSGVPALGFADGGIASLQEPRQGYFLGKIVKKAKRAVKKVVKSPIGKAAILAAPFLMSGAGAGGIGSFFGKGSFNPLKSIIEKRGFGALTRPSGLAKLLGKFGLAEGTKLTGLGKIAGIGALSGLGGLMAARGQEEDDEQDILDRGEGLDIDRIVRLARMNDPQFRFLPPAEFTGAYAEGGEVDKTTAMIMDLLKRGMDDDSISSITGASQEQIDSIKNNKREEKAEGGIMNLGGMEMDLRGGGFVPLGAKEKADDVPARLSKNEFVMTADAVRAAGGGSVDKGADKMYKLMKGLEAQV